MGGQSGVYRGVSAEDRAAVRRQRLVEATLTVWARVSAEGGKVTMTAICAEAELTERYFYESFAGLDEALVAVLDAVAEEIEVAGLEAADAAGSDPVARVRASVVSLVALVQDDPRKGRVAIVEAGAMPALRPRRTEILRHFAHRTAEEGEPLGGLRPVSAQAGEMAGLLFIGGLAELITAWLDGVLQATPDEIVDAAIRSFVGFYA